MLDVATEGRRTIVTATLCRRMVAPETVTPRTIGGSTVDAAMAATDGSPTNDNQVPWQPKLRQ
jgi:hypothetical protein